MFTFHKKTYGARHKKVIFFLTGWYTTEKAYWVYLKTLELSGYRTIIYTYDKNIIVPDINDTIDHLMQVKESVLQQIHLLQKEGITDFSVFGTSLGTIIAFLIANEAPAITKLIINLSGADVADIIWSWDTVHFFKKFRTFKATLQENGVALPQLKTAWKVLSPIYNIENIQNKKILLYACMKDELIPYQQQVVLIEELKKRKYDLKITTNSFMPHALTAAFNLLNTKRYIDFLNH